ncbi:hypothetical protein H2198_003452 [Neophaeococcomyces mojaviensis]|uniref:Uncharacterized protein n=1 Tax=Neophaeococcomyces mojaviensis TaxID=3383035 RepID=A0ACC3ABA9_9EURO|nr:hypothetical protein H2198_003452 [Knufia sp. JES_112]
MSAQEHSFVEPSFDLDFHQLLVPKNPVDRKRRGKHVEKSSSSSDNGSFFIPEPLSRTNSVYSFSRASLSSQLAGLSSMSLPQAEQLAASITNLPTARKACRALWQAAEQINSWNRKALRMLKDLDGDDDIEWAAAAGRDSLEETNKTINKFENLINVYVASIEELQSRDDIGDLRSEELRAVVEQMEFTLISWDDVRHRLKQIHEQVEVAMEWEELWNTVLGEVGQELDSLSQLVFEMEEKRHMAYMTKTKEEPEEQIDINELESFIEEPTKKKEDIRNSRFSMTFESSPLGSPVVESPQDDTKLLSLFARMQPLRASLDFLPMRISLFEARADKVFPQACKELQDKRERLEKNWQQLSEEADRLRRELSEDRWIVVFRNAGRQAQKMAESVERSIIKVQDAVDAGYARSNPAALAKRVESFEAKKMHYMPAIQRVLTIIQKGLKDRLTVNGEILRLNKDLSARTRDLQDRIDQLATVLEPVTARSNSSLRESISSIVSADRSLSSGTFAGTPGSSPASSIDLPPHLSQKPASRYGLNGYTKPRAASSSRPPPLSANNRRISIQSQLKRPTTPASTSSRRTMSPAPPSVYQQGLYRPPVVPLPPRQAETPSDRPRWSSTVRTSGTSTANKRASITPSSYYRIAPRSLSTSTAVPLRSPLSRQATSSPIPSHDPQLAQRHSHTQLRSFADRIKSPMPNESGLLAPVPYSKSRSAASPLPGTIRSPSSLANRPSTAAGVSHPVRPTSSLRSSRTTTALPQRAASPIYHQAASSPMNSLDAMMKTPPRRTEQPTSVYNEDTTILNDEDQEDESPEDDRSTELASSPLSKRTITRPPSSASSARGKRVSMLPVPRGTRSSSLKS